MATMRQISLRGVEVHNLCQVDLDLPYQQLIVFCGLSGSGKTSLAIDTLYTEGQRRYIESFSAYTRQFLERLEKPAAERIDGIPAAIAVTGKQSNRSSRATVATATEITDYLRLLFAKIGVIHCLKCGRLVQSETPQMAAEQLNSLLKGTRFMVIFEAQVPAGSTLNDLVTHFKQQGFRRAIWRDQIVNLSDPLEGSDDDGPFQIVVDRLAAQSAEDGRLRDSLETASQQGEGRWSALIEDGNGTSGLGKPVEINGKSWRRLGFSNETRCEDCDILYPGGDPRLFSFNSPLGACNHCDGFGNVIDIDMDRVVPDRTVSLRDGAIAPWNTPAYAHELEELLELADDYNIPVDVPYDQLTEEQLKLIREGVPDRDFGGLVGYFNWLERHKYKVHIRVFLSRWRSYDVCPVCQGTRLQSASLATRVGDKNIAEYLALKVDQCRTTIASLQFTEQESRLGRMMIDEVQSRLGYLESVGLGYLTLDRSLRTLSAGESQRVALTTALGSSLVNMLYVLDEPSIGLHPHDVQPLIDSIRGLRDRGNTVVVVEHEEEIIRAADQIVEVGPGAGEQGGEIVFQGTADQMEADTSSLTGDYLAGRRGVGSTPNRRPPDRGWVRLTGACGHNLQYIQAEFPLGLLCLVTGVSGAGKSTLVQDTLYPALCQRLKKDAPKPLPYEEVFGDGQIDDCVLVDQSPIGRSPRSNPVTYLKAFDEIRAVLADTVEARTRNLAAGHFSFNVDGGRCNQCKGGGHIEIDMQFLADVYMRCPQCNGNRYRSEILDIRYRGRNVAEILDLTVREAFLFFRGQPKVQAKLKRLIDVGLDYLRLGQPANTLSGGESQRLKLASYTSSTRRGRTLFILDEPTTGLHFADVVQLQDCFDALLDVGHSLIVVDHNLQLMKAADYVIDIGPGAADQGGKVIGSGTPEELAQNEESVTGQFLSKALSELVG